MNIRTSRVRVWAAAFALTLGVGLAMPGTASAVPSDATCVGGPVAPGTYGNLEIAGVCMAVDGDVHVMGSLTVDSGATLIAVFSSSNVTIDGNAVVSPGGSMFLGCEPEAFPCFDDPSGLLATHDVIRGTLVANGALASVVHHSTIGSGLRQSGGGGGVTCDTPIPGAPPFLPAYSDYEDNAISGGVTVSNLTTCWLGLFRNHVNGTVNYNNNKLADPDANEVANNTVRGSLKCTGNDPAVQIGDSGGGPNTVTGMVTGQCANPVIS